MLFYETCCLLVAYLLSYPIVFTSPPTPRGKRGEEPPQLGE